MTPKILAPGRRFALARLGGLTLVEAGVLALGGAAFGALLRAVTSGGDLVAAGAMLAALAVVGSAAAWLRAVLAERVSMSYANDLRGMLMEHAVASSRSRRRLGLLAVRLTGDVTPMRDWVASGLADAGSAAASILAAIYVFHLAAGWPGAGLAASLIAGLAALLVVTKKPLAERMRALRAARGRVSALAGDIVLGAATIARYGAIAREKRRFSGRAETLLRAAVRRRRLAALLQVPGGLVTALAVSLCVALLADRETIDWTLLLFAAGLFAAAFSAAGRAMDSFIAYSVAEARMQVLAGQIEAAAARPKAAKRAPTDALFLARIGTDEIALYPEDVVMVRAASSALALTAAERNAAVDGEAALRGKPLSRLKNGALGRRVALIAPGMPLVRGSLRRNLSLGRREASEEEMRAALEAVGLIANDWPLSMRIDPAVDAPAPHVQALMRLARALTHRADVLIVAEPLLYHAPEAPALLERLAKRFGVSVLAACAVAPLAGQRSHSADTVTARAS